MLKRKILALLLCVCMAVTVLPVTALAGEEETPPATTEPTAVTLTIDGAVLQDTDGATLSFTKVYNTEKTFADSVKKIAFKNTDANAEEADKVKTLDVTKDFTITEKTSVAKDAAAGNHEIVFEVTLVEKEGNYPYNFGETEDAETKEKQPVTKCEIKATCAVTKADHAITLSKATENVEVGTPATVTITDTAEVKTGITYTVISADSTVVTGTISGTTLTINGVKAGTAKLTVNAAATDNYNAATAGEINVTVKEPKKNVTLTLTLGAVTELKEDENEADKVTGYSVPLTVAATPSEALATVEVTCTDLAAEKITGSNGSYTAILPTNETETPKVYTFTATVDADDTYNAASETCTVTISKDGAPTTHTHTWDEGKVTTEPTETEAGVKTYTCTGCPATKTEVIPATGTTTPEEPDTPVTPPSGGGTTTTPDTPATPEVAPSTTVSGSTANATVSSSQGSGLVEAAKNPGTSEVTVKVETDENVTEANVTLPASAVKGVGDNKADLTITTPVADVTLPSEALTGLGSGASNVTVSAAINDDQSVSVTVKKDSTTVETLAQPMKVTVGVEDLTDTTVAYLVNADGTETLIKKSIAREDEMDVLLKGSAKVVFKENEKSFNDISGHWASSSIGFATSHELFQGTGEGVFSPEVTMTRGMIVTVLHRLEDTPQGANASFGDVGSGSYCAEAVAWGSEKGIVLGAGGNSFNPDGEVTRQDLATFRDRYAGKYGVDTTGRTNLSSFPDAGAVNSYAKDALEWAFNAGLIKGGDDGRLDPAGKATRAQVAAILQRFVSYINK